MLSALLFGAAAKTPPPNPLGLAEIGLSKQYATLNNPAVVTIPFDISSASAHQFDPDHPPLFLDLARKETGSKSWVAFLNGMCLTKPSPDASWAGECRKLVSALRDDLCIFSAIYPGPGTKYPDDPWNVVQEDVAHKGYFLTGDYLDMFSVPDNQPQRDAQYIKIQAWVKDTINTIGLDGNKRIFGKSTNPTWNEYVKLVGAIYNDGSYPSATSPYARRFVNPQFWGQDQTAIPGFDGYENLGLLFKTQLKGAFGNKDENWNRVMSYTDMTYNNYGYYEAQENFHELRKQIRAMWRTFSDYPEIMPLSFYPYTLNGKIPALWDTGSITTFKLNGDRLIYLLFANSAAAKQKLANAQFPPALVQLATSMAIGGYYHLDYFMIDPSLDPEAHMGLNDCAWDFVERFGYINDFFMQYKYSLEAGKTAEEVAELKDRMNGLWFTLKGWLNANDVRALINDLLLPYFPVGNLSSQRDLTPFFPASNLPVLIINTRGFKIPPREALLREVNATLTVYENSIYDPPVTYQLEMKQHGQSTRLFPKHSYGVTFMQNNWTEERDVNFLKMGKDSGWMFKGFYIDMTLIRDPLAYNISNQMGMYAPKSRQVELYVIDDGSKEVSYFLHYQGVYCIEEKISRGKQRIDIPKQDPTEPGWTPGKGGFIYSADKVDAGDFVIPTGRGGRIQISYPGKTKINKAMKDFTTDYWTRFETALYHPEWLRTGYSGYSWDKWIDLDSWVTYFLHAEFFKSVDAHRFSVYFYISGEGQKLHMGPPWDFDLGLGNTGWVVDSTGVMRSSKGWAFSHQMELNDPSPAFWVYRLMDLPAFKHTAMLKWQAMRGPGGVLQDSNIKSVINGMRTEIAKPINRNFQKWETLGSTNIWPYAFSPAPKNLDEYYDELTNFLTSRAKWLDQNLPRVIPHATLSEFSTCDVGDKPPECPTGYPWTNYPRCEATYWWLLYNWQSDPKFAQHGVDGSPCSVQAFLYWENNTCPNPPSYNPDAPASCVPGVCKGPFSTQCKANMDWMRGNWKTSPIYAQRGVDGSECSFQKYLSVYGCDGTAVPCCPPPRGQLGLICVNDTCIDPLRTDAPTTAPTPPTFSPSSSPTLSPTKGPVTNAPSRAPTAPTFPTTAAPSALPTASPTVPREADKGGGGGKTGVAVGVTLGVLALIGTAVIALLYIRKKRALGAHRYVAMNADAADYQPPVVVSSRQ